MPSRRGCKSSGLGGCQVTFGSRFLGVRFLFLSLLRSFSASCVLGFRRCFELPFGVKRCGVYLLCSAVASRLMSLPQAHPTPLDACVFGLIQNAVSYWNRCREFVCVKQKSRRTQSIEAARAVTAAATLGAKRRRSRAVTALAASMRTTLRTTFRSAPRNPPCSF